MSKTPAVIPDTRIKMPSTSVPAPVEPMVLYIFSFISDLPIKICGYYSIFFRGMKLFFVVHDEAFEKAGRMESQKAVSFHMLRGRKRIAFTGQGKGMEEYGRSSHWGGNTGTGK